MRFGRAVGSIGKRKEKGENVNRKGRKEKM
jgi:hypothetical protein